MNPTREEIEWMGKNSYHICERWIGPIEGYDYKLVMFGEKDALCYRKSWRACYNFAKRHASAIGKRIRKMKGTQA